MNGKGFSVMQIFPIPVKYQARDFPSYILFIEECQVFVIDTISDFCAARYLDFNPAAAKNSKVIFSAAASHSSLKCYIRAIKCREKQ